jgi:hypothetical protein
VPGPTNQRPGLAGHADQWERGDRGGPRLNFTTRLAGLQPRPPRHVATPGEETRRRYAEAAAAQAGEAAAGQGPGLAVGEQGTEGIVRLAGARWGGREGGAGGRRGQRVPGSSSGAPGGRGRNPRVWGINRSASTPVLAHMPLWRSMY